MLSRFNPFLLAFLVVSLSFSVACTRSEKDEKEQKSADKQTVTASPDNKESSDAVSKGNADLEKILAGYYEAIGGRKRWEEVKTVKYTGTMDSMGRSIKLAFVYKRPDMCRLDFGVNNVYFIQAYDGQQGWKYTPTERGSEPIPLAGEELDDLKETCDFDGPLIDYKKKGHKIEYLGVENKNGKEAYNLKITFNTGNVDYYYLDADTYLPSLVEGTADVEGEEKNTLTKVGGYIETGGLTIPYDFEYVIEGKDETDVIRISTVELNVDVDDQIFRFPRRPGGESY